MWNSVVTAHDAANLTKLFGGFHDGCIREVQIWTETSVESNLRMSCPPYLDSKLRIYFQRQSPSPSALELQFEELVEFHYTPTPDNYDSIILHAEITLEAGCFYWREKSVGATNGIGGKKLQWRDVSGWMGKERHYHAGDPA